MAPLRLRGLSGTTADRAFAISDVDLDIADGEICALIGPSGSGKSTLMRLIVGLEPVTEGTIRLGEEDMTGWPPERRNLAWLPQHNPLPPHRTVGAGMADRLRARRGRRPDDRDRVAAEARVAGLDRLLGRRPATLAAGERQAAGLARTAVRAPSAYVLDEPLGCIDEPERARLRGELGRLVRGLGVPVLLATNDQREALALGDRLAVLRDGRIAQHGSTLAVHGRPASVFVADFVGAPGMNLVEGVLEAGARTTFVRLPGGAVALTGVPAGLRARLDGRPVVLGVRPEHARLAGEGAPLSGVVEAVEYRGVSRLVLVAVGAGTRLTCAAPAHGRLATGCRVGIELRRDHLHLFDPESGLALWHARKDRPER